MEQAQKYKRANSEILEIIKYLPLKEYKMIPQEKIDFYERNKDQSYNFNYDPQKSLNEQNVLRETKALIVALFRDVFATEEQKEKLKIVLAQNEQKYQEELSKKYTYDGLFDKKQKNDFTKDEKTGTYVENKQMELYRDNIFAKILKFIKKWFNK